MHIVNNPLGLSDLNSPFKSCQVRSILSGLMISSLKPGTERHPSSKDDNESLSKMVY